MTEDEAYANGARDCAMIKRALKQDDDMEQIKAYIDLAVIKAINGLKKSRMLEQTESAMYTDASEIIKSYYKNGMREANVRYAIEGLRFDPYYRIIDLYYGKGLTIDKIAAELGVDASTVVRNKKRLCLEVYKEIV